MDSTILRFLFILICTISIDCLSIPDNYLKLRENIIKEESDRFFGSNLMLKGKEIAANKCLMRQKFKEVDEGFRDPKKFLAAQNFLEAREKIGKSNVFQIIRTMPKGGLFHAHISAVTSLDRLLKLAYKPIYQNILYVCFKDDTMRFLFTEKPGEDCHWQLLSQLRKTDRHIEKNLRSYLHLAKAKYDDIDHIWMDFEKIFDTIKGLITYRPFFEEYFYEVMEELYEDNIMFIEVRSSFSKLYELNGTYHEPVDVAKIYQKVSKRFSTANPDFLGMKVIYSVFRGQSPKQLQYSIEMFKKVKAAYPDFVIGFDLIGQEDKYNPLLNFIDQLKVLASTKTAFFFHAGETNWSGLDSDRNLIDAILLNTTRIGHGFALLKHAKLLEMVKERDIAIELNPISNQVLKLVKDMRNHPASYLFAQNFPVVVSSDDPAFWGASGLSHDFYETFIGIMPRDADLRALKQLAINSITYSGLSAKEKKEAFVIFEKDWAKYISNLVNHSLCKS